MYSKTWHQTQTSGWLHFVALRHGGTDANSLCSTTDVLRLIFICINKELQYHFCIKEDELGGVCGRHGEEKKYNNNNNNNHAAADY